MSAVPTHTHYAPPPQLRERANFVAELAARSISIAAMARAVGTSRNSVLKWAHCKTSPSPARRERAEAYFADLGIDPSTAWQPSELMSDTPHLHLVQSGEATTNPNDKQVPMRVTSREFLEQSELEHFNLSLDPFDDLDDPEDIYLSGPLQRIEHALLAAIKRRQIVALVGDPGAGKSTLLRRLYGRARKQKSVRLIATASLDRARITAAALSVAVLRDLIGKDTSSMPMERRSELLRTTLMDMDAQGAFPVLLIDEAHLLTPKALLAIKQIWDSHVLFRQLAVILVGQPRLMSRLKTDPTVRELTGRTRIIELPKYSAEDVRAYLAWRFARVQADPDRVFDESAYRALAARGEYPLWINNQAVNAMRYAVQVGEERVTSVIVGRS